MIKNTIITLGIVLCIHMSVSSPVFAMRAAVRTARTAVHAVARAARVAPVAACANVRRSAVRPAVLSVKTTAKLAMQRPASSMIAYNRAQTETGIEQDCFEGDLVNSAVSEELDRLDVDLEKLTLDDGVKNTKETKAFSRASRFIEEFKREHGLLDDHELIDFKIVGDDVYRIVPYDDDMHKEAVKEIAMPVVFLLASDSSARSLDEVYIESIKPAFSGTGSRRSRVLLKNEKVIGFINYTLCTSWFIENVLKYILEDAGQVAVIDHLAVDHIERGSGGGKMLMRFCINDCKKNSINKIKLKIIDTRLRDFYNTFGFELYDTGRGAHGMHKHLRQNPVLVAVKKVLVTCGEKLL